MAAGTFITAEEVERSNAALDPAAPAVLVDLDWRAPGERGGPSAGGPFYPRKVLARYLDFVRLMGLVAYVALPHEAPGSYKANVVGLFLTGGRDLHPRFYHQALNGTHLSPASESRYPVAMRQYEWARGRLPVLGVCWGSQFLLVAAGGSLVQQLPNAVDHLRTYNLLRLEEGSWLHSAVGAARMVSHCNHHQGYHRVPARYRVTAWDADDMPHSFESVEGVPELGFLGHPERLLSDPRSRRMAAAFGELCRSLKTLSKPEAAPHAPLGEEVVEGIEGSATEGDEAAAKGDVSEDDLSD
mgnify:CR=1 FL=1